MKEKNLNRAVKYIESWIKYNFPFARAVGLVVALGHDDEVLFQKAYGMANMEKRILMRQGHLFRIASHSKMFTAVSLMQLVEQGELRLDEPLVIYLQWLKKAKDKRYLTITARHLLEHAAGVIRDGADPSYWELARPFPTKEELIKDLQSTKLVFESNEHFKYSNYGFSILGLLIEAISGLSYVDYLQKNIFSPLKMFHSGADVNRAADKSYFATGYSIENKALKRKPLSNPSTNAMAAATGVYASAEDLCKFSRIFYKKNPVLSEMSRRDMTRIHWNVTENKYDDFYGFGCNCEKIGLQNYSGHGGGFPGFITRTIIDTKSKITLVVLRNSLDGPNVAYKMIRIIQFFGGLNFSAASHKLDEYEGRYENNWGASDILNRGDRLVCSSPMQWGIPEDVDELKQVRKDEFIIEKASGIAPLGETVKFIRSNRKIVSMNYAGRKARRISQ